jgi:heme-degrading monooxygenase HmoA
MERNFFQMHHGADFTDKILSNKMILELAILNVIPEKTAEFEASFESAQEIISSVTGYLGHQLQQCLEVSNRYVLMVQWEKLEDHTIGFRESPAYQEWKKLLHHCYSPFPLVEHYFLKYDHMPK